MTRFCPALLLFAIASGLRADVVNFDFKTTSNTTGSGAFTATGTTNGSWTGATSDGFVLASNGAGNTGPGSAYISQNNAFQMGMTGTATIRVNHFWNFNGNNVDGARLAISDDNGATWNYATLAGFTANPYNGVSATWAGDAWTNNVGGAGAQVTSVYQLNVANANANYKLRFEALFSGNEDYQGNDIWGINTVAVSVPEPGTLLLGGIAAASGGAGVWWKRRRKNGFKKDETVADATTATSA
jgi:hypothetical protein